jgi:hypothetical protein
MKNIFNDAPVSYNNILSNGLDKLIASKDELGVQDYAKALADFTKECETPMTIGIQGDWGIGKTSLLNMIKAYLEGTRNKNYGTIWFNTWHYSLFGQDEYLGVAVIKGLLDQMKSQFSISDDNNTFKKVAERVGSVLKNVRFGALGINVSAADAVLPDNSPESKFSYNDTSAMMLTFKESFQDLVDFILEKEKLDRLVFFIDDLDRVKPLKALELLESIKNFLDVENCVFILAVDYEVVQIGMAQKLGQDLQKISGKSFFDKIIQLPFTMPSNSYDLGNYIKSLLDKSGFRVNDDEVDFYDNITSCTVGRNPRSIKRIINYAKLIRLIRGKHTSSQTRDSAERRKVLYALLCMQVAWPEIFTFFVNSPTPATIKNIEDWNYLDTIPYIQKLYDRTPNVDQLKSNISSYFDSLYDLLDNDNNGEITEKELTPVYEMLLVARLTTLSDFTQPIDKFYKIIDINDNKGDYKDIKIIFKKSKWVLSGKIEYRISGKRYVTIVHNRKQIGSLVSLNKAPFIFRLVSDEVKIVKFLQSNLIEINFNEIIYANEKESLSGFGDVVIDFCKLSNRKDKIALKILNLLFDFIVK